MDTLGRHLLIELWGCRRATDDCEAVRRAMVESVEAIRATILHLHVHAFSPYGVTGVAVLAESHLSIHTWPERGYVAADVFTCGETAEPTAAIDVLRTAFQAEHAEIQQLLRGVRPANAAGVAVRSVSPAGRLAGASLPPAFSGRSAGIWPIKVSRPDSLNQL